MVDFTGGTWRSLIDGSEVSAIPDPDVYLHDDWGDNQLTSDREESGTTTHNGETGVYRPEWTVDSGDPEATGEELVMDDDDVIRADINLNLGETVTWEILDWDFGDSSSNDSFTIVLFAESASFTTDNGGREGYAESYGLRVSGRAGGSELNAFGLFKLDSDFNSDDLIDGNGSTDGDHGDPIKITRDENGEWELFYDGVSQGTETDTEFTDPAHTGFVARDGRGETHRVGEYKVF